MLTLWKFNIYDISTNTIVWYTTLNSDYFNRIQIINHSKQEVGNNLIIVCSQNVWLQITHRANLILPTLTFELVSYFQCQHYSKLENINIFFTCWKKCMCRPFCPLREYLKVCWQKSSKKLSPFAKLCTIQNLLPNLLLELKHLVR